MNFQQPSRANSDIWAQPFQYLSHQIDSQSPPPPHLIPKPAQFHFKWPNPLSQLHIPNPFSPLRTDPNSFQKETHCCFNSTQPQFLICTRFPPKLDHHRCPLAWAAPARTSCTLVLLPFPFSPDDVSSFQVRTTVVVARKTALWTRDRATSSF